MGILDLRLEAGLSGIELLIRSLRTPGQPQSIVSMFLQQWQTASGMSMPLLEFPNIRAPHLEGFYYTYLRDFLATHEMSLEIDGITPATPPRENDACIMDLACSDSSLTDTEDLLLQKLPRSQMGI